MSHAKRSLIRRLCGRKSRRWIGGVLLAASIPGCSRQFWRQQADMDVYDAVAQKMTDERWQLPRVDVTADPRSRFFDPNDPDRPPLPPDDPAAHVFMHWVDGWQGYKGWHQFGDLLSVENPQWLEPFGITPEMFDPATGLYVGQMPAIENMTLLKAVELSLIHSREYQTQIESLYLAALDVTFERFQFGVRYLGAFGEPGASLTTRMTPDGIDANDGAIGTSEFGISQLLPSGAQWAVELTNNTLWLFSGGNQTNTASTLSYSLTQPLFLGAGRKVVLESLTLTERILLYAARDLARFRQDFFTDVVATSNATSFFGLLQTRQQIINQQDNLRRLDLQARKLQDNASRGQIFPNVPILNDLNEREALAVEIQIPPDLSNKLMYDEANPRLRWAPSTPMTLEESQQILAISDDPMFQTAARRLISMVRNPGAPLDVLQILSQYNTAQNQLRNTERQYQDNMDAYKILLGLPPTMPVTLDVSLLKQFELIDPVLRELEDFADVQFSAIWGAASPPEAFIVDPDIPAVAIDPEQVRSVAQQFSELVNRVGDEGLALVLADVESVRAIVPGRLEELEEYERARLQTDFDRDQRIIVNTQGDYEAIRGVSDKLVADLSGPRFSQEQLVEYLTDIKEAQEDLVRLVRTLSVLQVGLRAELIELNKFHMAEDECLSLALANRVDLMNARAQVMDARRRVEVAANALQASMTLVAEGDFGTTNRTNPFAFNGDNSQIRFGVRFKAPLDQIAERNLYRAALIDYQREKRSYMLFEDGVKQQVRRALRGTNVQARNLETARGAIRRAALQYDATNEQTDDPARAAQQAGSNTGGLQGNNVLQSLNNILQAQNQLVSTWFDYERNRLNLYRDMGTMVIGPDGVWDDPFYRNMSDDNGPPSNTIPIPPLPAGGVPAGDLGDGIDGGLLIPRPDPVP